MRTALSLAVALVAALVLAAPASAAPRQFQSPTRNIGCLMGRGFVRCDIAKRSWTPPRKPASCPVDYGQGITVGRHGRAAFVCAGDTVAGAGPVLRYGRSIHLGAMTCTSRRSGMRCRARSGHGFLLSRQSYRLF